MRSKRTRIANSVLKEKNKVRRPPVSDFPEADAIDVVK
jgi:hypothetical protein